MQKLNCGIGPTAQHSNINFINPELFSVEKIPKWLRGCSTIGKRHPTALRWFKKNKSQLDLDDVFIQETVALVPLDIIIQACGITSVGLLKMDTEGMDAEIILNSMPTIKSIEPEKIVFEINELNESTKTESAISKLKGLGYAEVHRGRDIVLRKAV